jgi:phage/plasmid-associated DNA primase
MEQNCIEADNVLSKDGIMSYAPTDYETLYDNYVEWCQEEELQNRADKKTFKTEILDWQKNSKYGLSIGKTKEESEGMPNGYLRSPLINLKIV